MRRFFGLAVVSLAAVAGCAQPAPSTRLAAVAPLPSPSLPPWISSVGPRSPAQSLAQIRVIFAKPVTPVESLEGDGPRDVLAHLRIDPALKGRFVVLTPRMIGFVADQALPVAARVRVTMTAGLRDLSGDSLDRDIAWTFETAPLAFSNVPGTTASGAPSPPPVSLMPSLRVDANTLVDPASLAAHARLHGSPGDVALRAHLVPTPSPAPGAYVPTDDFTKAQQRYTYELQPLTQLAKGTVYALTIDPGVEPAEGNVPTTKRFTGTVHTFDALRIVATPAPNALGAATRFAGGDPAIVFNNPIDEKTIAGNVTVSPLPSPAPRIGAYASDGSTTDGVAIDPYALDPGRDYTVTIAPGLKDIFGQSFASAQIVAVHTGEFAPGMWAPSGTSIVPAASGVDLNVYATNLPDNRYRAAFVPVSPQQLIAGAYAESVLPSPAPSWPLQTLTGASVNRQSVVRISAQDRLHGPYGTLAYGFWAPIGGADGTSSTGLLQITNLGVFAQWFPQHGIVLVSHLDDGSPAPRAHVDLYRISEAAGVTPKPCASGTTDAAGGFDLGGTDLERCYISAAAGNAPSIGVVVREGSDVATLRTFNWSGVYAYDVMSGWASGVPLSRGVIFSDRQLYQPGERAQLTGIAYYVRGGAVVADPDASYRVELTGPSGTVARLPSVTTDRYGIFTLPYTFSKTQALGYYNVAATGPNGNVITGDLRVAEFKPPNFKLDLSLSAPSAIAGGSVLATAKAAYLFGAPLQGGKAHAYVTRSPAQVAPAGWDEFSFGRQWFWPEQPPEIPSDVVQRDLPLDATGQAQLAVAVPAAGTNLPAPMTYRVDVDATDVSNLSVSGSQSFLALPADGVIGLASDTVGAAKVAMPVRVIVTDAQGKAIPGRGVHLNLEKMTYTSATQAEEGGENAEQSVRYDSVGTADVTSSKQAVTATLIPPEAGSYRVRATFSGSTDVAAATDIQVFAYGPNAADFGQTDKTSVRITLDKKKYRVGDMATALVGSPFDHSDVYLSVIRNGVIYKTVLHDTAGAPHVSFRVTPDMAPNAALEAVVVRRGRKLASVKPGSLDSLSRVGVAGFDIDMSDRYLRIGIVPQKARLAPGATQHVQFTLRDTHGRGLRGKIVAMAVNEAVLQLSGYRLPDLVQTIFADQPISTRFADNRENVTLRTAQAPVEKGFGFGGGFLEGAAGTRVRTNFLPLAYYGAITTDASGNAAASFAVPDDLTTWRVMAVAIAQDDAHFGTADATFVSTLPLMANPLLPQFARPGDEMNVGASVMNQTGAAGALDVRGTLAGALRFANGLVVQETHTQAPGIAAYRFPVTAGTPAPSTVAFRAGLGSASDAFSVPFEVTDRNVTESVIESGATSTTADIPIAFDRPGTLSVTVANSVVPQFAVPAARALQNEGVGISDEYASRVVIAASLRSLQAAYHLRFDVDAAKLAQTNVRDLVALQRGDGGFSAFAGGRQSDAFGSAFALEALAYAAADGVTVDSSVLASAKRFAADALANPSRFSRCDTALCKAQMRFSMLWSLAAAGDRRTEFLPQIFAARASLDDAAQIRLARYLLATPGWQKAGSQLADELTQTLYLTGRYASANLESPWGWLGTDVDAQAQMLHLLVERKAPSEQIDGAIRALLAQRCACGWPSLDATAAAVRALGAYAATAPLKPVRVSVRAGNATIGEAEFSATPSSRTFVAPTASLHGGKLTVASSGGTAHYLALYTYAPANDAAGALSAFRVTRTISDVGASASRATMDLAALASPVTLDAGRVFDIGLRVAVDHPVSRLVIEDPLPAGFEAVDATFKTANPSIAAQSDAWQIDSRTIYRDRVMAFAQHLEPGVYEMHYLVRSVTPGRYRWPGASAYLQDAPEQFGRTASAVLELR